VEQGRHRHEALAHGAELVAPLGQRRERFQLAGRFERALEVRSGAGEVARDPDPRDEREHDRDQQHAGRLAARLLDRLERDLLLLARVLDGFRAQLVEDGAHLVGANLPDRNLLRLDDLVVLARLDLRLADVLDPIVHQAPEGGDALVFLAILGGGLGFDEDALEILPRLVVGREKARVARQQVAALARLEVGGEPQEHLGVVGELEIVLHETIELVLELLVRERRSVQADPEHSHHEQRREQNPPEQSTEEEAHAVSDFGTPRERSQMARIADFLV